MKKVLVLVAAVLTFGQFNAQSTIADARVMGIGQTVTIKGVITNGSELGSIRYVQDETGALPIYGTGFTVFSVVIQLQRRAHYLILADYWKFLLPQHLPITVQPQVDFLLP